MGGRMIRLGGCLLCMALAGCSSVSPEATSRVSATDAALTATTASCAAQTPATELARAALVFDALALPGRAEPRSHTLLSPARFRVLDYVKGRGSNVVKIDTAVTETRQHGAYNQAEDGIAPRAGQRWLIYGRRTRGGVISADRCTGSRLRHGWFAHPLPPDGGPALTGRG